MVSIFDTQDERQVAGEGPIREVLLQGLLKRQPDRAPKTLK